MYRRVNRLWSGSLSGFVTVKLRMTGVGGASLNTGLPGCVPGLMSLEYGTP